LPSPLGGVFGLIRVVKELFFENSGDMAKFEAVMTGFLFFDFKLLVDFLPGHQVYKCKITHVGITGL
jgi:hypothetical protein